MSPFPDTKTTGFTVTTIGNVADYILWYAKDIDKIKFRKLFLPKEFGGDGASAYKKIELVDGRRMSISDWERMEDSQFRYDKRPKGSRVYTLGDLTSQSGGENARKPIIFNGKTYTIATGSWETHSKGIERLIEKKRIDVSSRGGSGYVRYFDDFPYQPMVNLWTDTVGQNQTGGDKIYVVQTAIKAIQRCILGTVV